MRYPDLYHIKDSFEDIFKANKDLIGSYSVEVIPDDMRIEVILVKIKPIKNIKCTVVVGSKENTDNVK